MLIGRLTKRIHNAWKNYKYRFVPWIAFNMSKPKVQVQPEVIHNEDNDNQTSVNDKCSEIQINHVNIQHDQLINEQELVLILRKLCSNFLYTENNNSQQAQKPIHSHNSIVMKETLGFTIRKAQSSISPNAGLGVFVSSGNVKAGSIVALYPGTLYYPYDQIFFQSIWNQFIFQCSDGIRIDGNNRSISKSIYLSCAGRDKFSLTLPCCDTSWLTDYPVNPLNIGQIVNNQTSNRPNNVVYQEFYLNLPTTQLEDEDETYFPIKYWKFLPNVWTNPENNNSRDRIKIVSLVAIRDIGEGEELLSSYFTIVHSST